MIYAIAAVSYLTKMIQMTIIYLRVPKVTHFVYTRI